MKDERRVKRVDRRRRTEKRTERRKRREERREKRKSGCAPSSQKQEFIVARPGIVHVGTGNTN